MGSASPILNSSDWVNFACGQKLAKASYSGKVGRLCLWKEVEGGCVSGGHRLFVALSWYSSSGVEPRRLGVVGTPRSPEPRSEGNFGRAKSSTLMPSEGSTCLRTGAARSLDVLSA